MRRLPLLLVLTLLPLCSGCLFSRVERKIESTLREKVGPADSYKAEMSHSIASVLGGRMRWFELEGRNVQHEGVVLEMFHLRVDDIRMKPFSAKLKSVRQANVRMVLVGDSLNNYLQAQTERPLLKETRLSFPDGKIRVELGKALLQELGSDKVLLTIEGRPVVREESKVDFEPTVLDVLRNDLNDLQLALLKSKINPIVDLSKMKFPVRLTELKIADGRLSLAGSASITPESLKKASEAVEQVARRQ